MKQIVEFIAGGVFVDGRRILSSVCGIYRHDETGSEDHATRDLAVSCKVDRAAQLLNDGHTAEAIFFLNFAFSCKSTSSSLNKAGYNQNEARNNDGEWSRENEAGDGGYRGVAYQGDFHDFMPDDILKALTLEGSIFIKETRLFSISGIFRARTDAIIRPKNDEPYLFELKTGPASMPTIDQFGVYRDACTGPHVFSPDPKIAILGYAPGELLPKMKVMFAYTEGPGKKVFFFNFCDLIGAGK